MRLNLNNDDDDDLNDNDDDLNDDDAGLVNVVEKSAMEVLRLTAQVKKIEKESKKINSVNILI